MSLANCKQLFLSFLKIGAFTFGGGYAMIPLIQKEAVEKHHWVSPQDILDIIAIAESTPGVIAVNSATFVGYKAGGFWGSVCATVGVVLPSFFVISAIFLFFKEFAENIWVKYAFEGIRAAVVVLMLGAISKLAKYCPKGLFTFLAIGGAFVASAIFNVNTILILVLAACTGIVYCLKMGGAKQVGGGKK